MARLALDQNHLPLHLIISEKLREGIINSQYLPGEQLPSEHKLMEQFGVSRITVRRAVSNLAHQGLVVSHHGKGVFVKEQRKVTYSLSNPLVLFDEDMARQGVTNSIKNLVFESVTAPDDVQKILNLPVNKPDVYLQKKLMLLDQVPVAVDATYILPALGKAFIKDLKCRMTFPILEENGVLIERVEATIASTQADYETSEYLNVSIGSPLLVYSYTAYTTNNKSVVCGEALSRGDRLCYSVVLTKGKDKSFSS